MTAMRSGILAAGNWIRDHVMVVDAWPEEECLANILGQSEGNGGGPYNILKDLAKLGAPFALAGVGLLGEDERGRAILADCRAHGIDTSRLRGQAGVSTSFTQVVSVQGTGRRTFFHHRGANALLSPGHIDVAGSTHRIFYLGYLFLLDALDAAGPDGVPAAREVLRRARSGGLVTALDCVSAAAGTAWTLARPVLSEVDILFANEIEAARLCGREPGRGPGARRDAEEAARQLAGFGVRRWAVVHFPGGACACSGQGEVVWQPAVRVAPGLVAGSAGAGDALAAGILLGLHEDWPIARCLELGVCTAAVSLLDPTCSGGVRPHAACVAFGRAQGFVPGP
jgi:sugar/nucleoside kinase (ribokinase family)